MAADLPDFQVLPAPTPSSPVELSRDEQMAVMLAQRNFATFWVRLGAALLDALVLGIVRELSWEVLPLDAVPQVPLLDVLYAIGFIAAGATPGMRAVKIRVIDAQGRPPGLKRSIIRYIIPGLSLLPLLILLTIPGTSLELGLTFAFVAGAVLMAIGLLDPLWMIWDENKQTLHDELAHTYVVNTR